MVSELSLGPEWPPISLPWVSWLPTASVIPALPSHLDYLLPLDSQSLPSFLFHRKRELSEDNFHVPLSRPADAYPVTPPSRPVILCLPLRFGEL